MRGTRDAVWVIIMALAVLAGCYQKPDIVPPPPPPVPVNPTAANPEDVQSATAVESSLALSERLAQVTERLLELQTANTALEETNRQLNTQLAQVRSEATLAQKELSDANALLLEMKNELVEWKKHVLGVQEEMRAADKAEMEALTKVLKLLGAEVASPPPPATTPPAMPAAVSPAAVAPASAVAPTHRTTAPAETAIGHGAIQTK